MKKINSRYEDLPDTKGKVKVIAVTGRPNGNYVITFTPDSCPQTIEAHKDVISKALAPDHPSVIVSKDEPWAKVIVHNISCVDDNHQPRTEANLMEAILVNPILKDVKITHPPRWVKPEERLEGKHATAISFAFIDKPDPILNNLLNSPFFMFGARVRLERWKEKLKPVQCKKCWKLTHTARQCPALNPRCRKCGKSSPEEQHPQHCSECKLAPSPPTECNHPCCPNCHGTDHCADDPNCPKIKEIATKPAPPPTTRQPRNTQTPTNASP
jgi:hypothetical protein